jgi:two-component system, NtrC family, response regulator AtoC
VVIVTHNMAQARRVSDQCVREQIRRVRKNPQSAERARTISEASNGSCAIPGEPARHVACPTHRIMSQATILLVDDEPLIRWSLSERLATEGYQLREAATGAAAIEAVQQGVDLVLLDYQLPDTDGASVLRQMREIDPDLLVFVLTAYATVETAVAAMKSGAYHVLDKPFNLDNVAAAVERALETTRLRREVRHLRSTAARPYSLQSIVGNARPVVELRQLIVKVATSATSTVLLSGESGTGKDLVAKVIHYISGRSSRPFMNITCSALPEPLLESELFGHERGSYTGADTQKRGLLESADGGTVFLDEIGEMVPALQAKLLRFLEEKTFKRVGGCADIHVDVRVIAATNRRLDEDARQGRFRDDLFYRLNVLPIALPPLRNRSEDVPLLIEYFIDGFNTEFRKNVLGASTDTYALLQRYGWPGNVRELRNVVERAILLSDANRLEPRHFTGVTVTAGAAEEFELPARGVNLEQVERGLVTQALRRCDGNQTRAGALLGLNRDQIRYRMEKFHLRAAASAA